jgi:DNA modification methylase
MIHTGDCIEVMAGMDADSVDAIVTDPPYGLGFRGKEWDSGKARHLPPSAEPLDTPLARFRTGKGPAAVAFDGHPFQAWCEAWGREALRVTKPGGYLLAFGGTRTHHRLVCGLEDAGWIIRDELDWIYASGFPKGKANLKPAHEPIVLARKPGPLRPLAIDACRIGTEGWSRQDREAGAGFSTGKFMGSMGNGEPTMKNGLRESAAGRWPSNVLLSDPALFDEKNPEVVGSGATATTGGDVFTTRQGAYGGEWTGEGPQFDSYGDSGGYARFFIIPKADRADREPVVRGQMTPAISGIGHAAGENGLERDDFIHPAPAGIGIWLREQREAAGLQQKQVAAHFPSKTGGLTGCVANWELEFNRPTPDQWRTLRQVIGFDDRYDEVMTATHQVPLVRFKPNGREQPVVQRENSHPTVKPVDLMRHLVRLVTPQGGTVLDPFLGSGSTAIAAELEGFPWLGIEKEPEYVAIAEARLHGTQRGLGLDVPAPTRQQAKPAGYTGERHPGREWTKWREAGENPEDAA